MRDWSDFYLTSAGAAATLSGLLFVALSVNKEPIGGDVKFRSLARQAALAWMFVLLVSLIALIPEQPAAYFGVEILAVALVFLIPSVLTQLSTYGKLQDGKGRYALGALVFDTALTVGVLAGVYMWNRSSRLDLILVPAYLLLGSIGVYNSWELVLRVDTPLPTEQEGEEPPQGRGS
ncbi:MAG: hypothetical protein JO161_00095 [Planctomycetaceae bacterium]|nr:hypothetical protein [Planctomycetaceae bacterium]